MWVRNVELASCYPSGAYNFEVDPRFLDNMCTPDKKPSNNSQLLLVSIFSIVFHLRLVMLSQYK